MKPECRQCDRDRAQFLEDIESILRPLTPDQRAIVERALICTAKALVELWQLREGSSGHSAD